MLKKPGGESRIAVQWWFRGRWIKQKMHVNNITRQRVTAVTNQLSGRDYCWWIYSLHCFSHPPLSRAFSSIMALSKTVSKRPFKYLWKQLIERCQGSSRWLMKGQDQASHTIEPQKASWTWHCRKGGEVEDREQNKYSDTRENETVLC